MDILQLLKVEWMKVKNYTTFWVLSILYLVSIFGVNYIAWLVWDARPKKTGMEMMVGNPPFQFPEVWHTISYASSFLMFIPGLLMIISVTNEYSFKTHRQNVIDGWSRKEFILVKILMTIIIALVSTVAVFLTALLFGLFEGVSAFDFEKIEYIGYFFIQSLSYTSIALLFSILFKRSGLSIGFYFLYSLILENMLAGFLNRYVDNFGRYMPLETTDNLIRVPVFKMIVNQLMASYNTTALLIMSAVYLGLYYFFSMRKFETDDL